MTQEAEVPPGAECQGSKLVVSQEVIEGPQAGAHYLVVVLRDDQIDRIVDAILARLSHK